MVSYRADMADKQAETTVLASDVYPAGVPCWIDSAQPEPERAAGFYAELFGWDFTPTDGYFVEFWRLLVEHPEIILWDRLFDEGKHGVLAEVRAAVKAVRPGLQAGFHIEHVNSFNPIFRATRRYDDLATKDDFLKIVVYNNCGGERYAQARDAAIALYRFGAAHAQARGVLLADTKFEFGVDREGVLTLADEAMTPDSSRFWPADGYAPGAPQPSFDKQYVRDWCLATGWDRTAPGPELPSDVVAGTRARYIDAFERLTEIPFERYLADPAVVLCD